MRRYDTVGHGARGRRIAVAAILLLAVATAGCSSISSSSPAGSAFGNLFSTPTTPVNQPSPNPNLPDPKEECPTVDVRAGAATLSVGTGGDASGLNLRYQASIARAARECAIHGTNMTMKIGVEGRIILGPAGAPSQVEVPLRLALVQEGVQPKTIWTKLYRIPVAIPPGQGHVPFVQIEPDLTFPLPSRNDLASYIVYVGFDQLGAKEPPAKKAKTKARKSR